MKCTVLVTLPSSCGIVHTWLTTPRWIVQFSGSMSGLPTLQHFLWWRVGCNPLHRIFARKWWVRMCRGNWNGVLTSWFCFRLWKSGESWHPSGVAVIAWWQVGSWWNLHSFSLSALELRMLAEWASQPWTMIRSPDMLRWERKRSFFVSVLFEVRLHNPHEKGTSSIVKYTKSSERMNGRSTFAKQWLCWRVVMEKACCGLSCPKEDPPCQLGLLLLASLDTYCRRWLCVFFPASRLDALYSDFSQGYDAYEQRKRGDGCESEEQVRNQDEAWCDMMQPCEFAGHHTKDVNCPAGASKPIFLAQCVRLSTHAWLDCHASSILPSLIGFPTRVGFRKFRSWQCWHDAVESKLVFFLLLAVKLLLNACCLMRNRSAIPNLCSSSVAWAGIRMEPWALLRPLLWNHSKEKRTWRLRHKEVLKWSKQVEVDVLSHWISFVLTEVTTGSGATSQAWQQQNPNQLDLRPESPARHSFGCLHGYSVERGSTWQVRLDGFYWDMSIAFHSHVVTCLARKPGCLPSRPVLGSQWVGIHSLHSSHWSQRRCSPATRRSIAQVFDASAWSLSHCI